MLKLLPVRDPERTVSLVLDKSSSRENGGAGELLHQPDMGEMRDHQTMLDGVTGYAAQALDIGSGGNVQRASGLFVSGRFFDVVGVRP